MISKITTVIALAIILTSCVSQSDYDKLKAEHEQLKAQLEKCENGAEKIIAKVEQAYAEKKYSEAKENIFKLYKEHPESSKNKEFELLRGKIEKLQLALKKKKEAELLAEKKKKDADKKEKDRIANLNNTGIWSVNYYVDDFGEPTKEGYIRNTYLISGAFSNTATQDSELSVRFLNSSSSNISIQLYEYASNNPVKAYSSEYYKVLILDKDKKRYNLTAINYKSDRLTFDKTNSRTVHQILMKGGAIKFKIVESDTPTTQYEFTIEKADWYDNAYRKLRES
ncbi:hypothetical protein [Labilibaculum antarcticum]|uniref:Uncharacterized protein n=1 Tax=Labilibaculum antarcticum TaxID=1717717 RepID=A0A1Y1CEG5_9BACT|nr:hypothetical protein [Labilibaculum antarcticum]BAX78503.1 hypothetical protein ALGA_0108 [Labilibaculum antarcticum]